MRRAAASYLRDHSCLYLVGGDFVTKMTAVCFCHNLQALPCAPHLGLLCRPQTLRSLTHDRVRLLLLAPLQSVPGLYVAGDVVEGLNQIAVAESQAAIAATAIHNRLTGADVLSLA